MIKYVTLIKIGCVLLLCGTLHTLAQTSTSVSDPNHSEVDFAITHMTISNVHGRFGGVHARLILNQSDITKSTVTATIDVATIDTGVDARNTDLKSANFFDVAHYPTATFTSTSVTKTVAGLTVTGNLTLHGVTRPVTLMVEGPNGPVQGMDHKQHVGFSAITNISRSAFGIGSKFPLSVVGDAVRLSLDLDVARQ